MDATLLDVFLLSARLLLAGVFSLAGLAKLFDQPGWRKAVVDFGLPSAVARPIGLVVPLAELALAVALLPAATAWWGAAGAAVLLAAFIAGLLANLIRGRRPDCRCFGQLGSGPINWFTLARNVLLIGVAVYVAWQPRDAIGPSAFAWVTLISQTEVLVLSLGVVGLAMLAGMAWLLLQLWQLIGRLLLRVDSLETRLSDPTSIGLGNAPADAAVRTGLAIGAPAPAFRLDGIHGETLTLDALRARGKPVMLLFADHGCGPCTALMPEIGRWQREYASAFTLVLISRGTADANRAKASEHGLTSVLLQQDQEISQPYEAFGTPSAVLVRPDGTIGSLLAAGADAIRALVTNAVGGNAQLLPVVQVPNGHNGHHHNHNGQQPQTLMPSAVMVGQPAPVVRLPDLDGKVIDLGSLRGKETLVLFWNPGCGFCQQMLPELKAWESNAPKGAPKLLVVSTGDVEMNRAMGLKSTVVSEPSFSVGASFGASGTPSAVLVDAHGNVASDVAVGAPAVLSLARAGAIST